MNRQTRRSRRAIAAAALTAAGLTAAPAVPAAAEEVQALEEVIVTAPRMEEPLVVETDPKRPRTPVPAADGAGYLKTIPGFSVVRKGGIDGDPLFRGQGGSRLNVLLDGTPLMGGCGMRMDPPTAYVFPESFDKITVLKGPQSVVHGGAMGATILMDRKTKRFNEPGVRGDVSALYGSWDRNDQMVDVTGGAEQGYVRVIGTRSASDDYKDGAGRKVHSQYDRKSATALVGWTPDDKTVIEASADVSEAEAAYADRTMDGVAFDRRDFKLEGTRSGLSDLVAEVSAQVYHNYIDHVMDNFSLRRNTGTKSLNNPDRTNYGGKLNTVLTPGGETTVTLGADVNRDVRTLRTGVDYESKARMDDMEFETVGVFGEASHNLTGASRLIGGYRLNRVETTDYTTTTGAQVAKDTDYLNTAFGRYEHDLNVGIPVTAYVGLGHTQRAPDYWERNKKFGLLNERATQLDVGVLHAHGKWWGAMSAFYARIDDYIILPAAGTNAKNVDARTMGGEAELAYRFLPSWAVEATAAYVHGENVSENKALPQMPPLEGTMGVKYDDGTFMGGLLMRAVAHQDRVDVGWGNIVGTDIGETGGFATLSANAGWRPYDNLTLTAGVDNILDKAYAEHISRTGAVTALAAEGYEQTVRVHEPGRTFWVKGNVRF
ncbi:MAG: TonB-dependent copper receptor [Pseudomonadota bacterium]